jgi:hypothetical protein
MRPRAPALSILVTLWTYAGTVLVLAAPAPSSSLGAKVVAYCADHLGEIVGNGECSALAVQSLNAAGAKRRIGKDNPAQGDYVWGRLALIVTGGDEHATFEAGKPSDIRPGDIIQFRDTRFQGRRGRQGYAHHTAVVASTDASGLTVKIYQQNVNGKKVVMDGQLRLNELKNGWLRFYHPIPPTDGARGDDNAADWK